MFNLDNTDDGELDAFQNGTQEVAPITPLDKPKWELKKLTTKHKRIAQLKVAGLTRDDIAKLCLCTPEYVTMLMHQPLMKNLMDEHHEMINQDLRDLSGSAVNTMRTMMDSPDDKVALTAATTVLRANGKLNPADIDDRTTAEDVVAKLFAIHNSNVQINIDSQKE